MLNAQALGKIPLALNLVGFATRRENGYTEAEELISPVLLCPVDGHGNDEIDRLFAQEVAGVGIVFRVVGFPLLHGAIMSHCSRLLGPSLR